MNLTRAEFYEFLNHAWNDVYWLAHILIWMGFVGMLLSHHYDLRLQMVGARMRIAACSLIYRKVKKTYFIFFAIHNLDSATIFRFVLFLKHELEFAFIGAIS